MSYLKSNGLPFLAYGIFFISFILAITDPNGKNWIEFTKGTIREQVSCILLLGSIIYLPLSHLFTKVTYVDFFGKPKTEKVE